MRENSEFIWGKGIPKQQEAWKGEKSRKEPASESELLQNTEENFQNLRGILKEGQKII